jgi:hypothetical protein
VEQISLKLNQEFEKFQKHVKKKMLPAGSSAGSNGAVEDQPNSSFVASSIRLYIPSLSYPCSEEISESPLSSRIFARGDGCREKRATENKHIDECYQGAMVV